MDRSKVTADFADIADNRVVNEGQVSAEQIERAVNAKITSRDADQGYLRSVIEYNKAITELNFRKGTLLQANSIYLAEGEWNPGAYEDAKKRADAMTHALDNTHVDAVPGDFSAGPAVNAWEAQSNADRPDRKSVV